MWRHVGNVPGTFGTLDRHVGNVPPHLASQRPVTRKSSKYVWASALVHKPILPAFGKVSSLTCRYFLPSSQHSICPPACLIFKTCHSPAGIFRSSLVPSCVRLPATTL